VTSWATSHGDASRRRAQKQHATVMRQLCTVTAATLHGDDDFVDFSHSDGEGWEVGACGEG